MAAHIALEESGEHYEGKKVDLAGGEQRTEAYLKINPLGRVPALLLDNGEPLAENTAILPFLGKRFNLWPDGPFAKVKALWLIGFFASSVHGAFAHVSRPERYASDSTAFHSLKETGPQGLSRLPETDRRHASRTRMVLRPLHRSATIVILWLGNGDSAEQPRSGSKHSSQPGATSETCCEGEAAERRSRQQRGHK